MSPKFTYFETVDLIKYFYFGVTQAYADVVPFHLKYYKNKSGKFSLTLCLTVIRYYNRFNFNNKGYTALELASPWSLIDNC